MVVDPEYVAARRVLLDALEALGPHRKAVVLVGAQAIYLHVGLGDLTVAPFTTGADLALNPNVLDDEPILAEMLVAVGFHLSIDPGIWSRSNIPIGFLVPFSLSGAGRRNARLGPHETAVARKAKGFEAASADCSIFRLRLPALNEGDSRAFDIAVAGPAALLIAKLHKIHESAAYPGRWAAKDGLDILRLLQSCDLQSTGTQLNASQEHSIASEVTQIARGYLRTLFAAPGGEGAKMALRATLGLEDEATIAASCEALASVLLAVWKQQKIKDT